MESPASMRPSSKAATLTTPAAAVGTRREHAPSSGLRRARRWLLLVPVAAFVGLAIMFGINLHRDPSLVPSPLIGQKLPAFRLPPVQGRSLGLASDDLQGEVSLVNVFASWCVACRAEHPLLMHLKAQGIVPVHGLDYKDKPEDAARWLDTMGDPYWRTGADLDGRVAIDWGVYGVPETFVVDRSGRIALKQVGPIDRRVLDETILPLIERLRADPAGAGPRP